MVVPLTADVASVRQAINRLSPHGDTSLFDGTYAALVSTLQETGRSLVVVCTDGRDTTSWLEPDEVLESARRTNAVVYIVATGGARRWGVLKDLADATGGQLMELASSADLRPQFQKILDEFRSRYVLTYTPVGVTRDGFHRLDVRVRRGGLTVKARPGYIGGMK
jgi:VWFA-related protein